MNKLLVHICCCHCAAFTLRHFAEKFAVDAFWYNPNIAPNDEYNMRLAAMRSYASACKIPLIEDDEHDYNDYISRQYKASERCEYCLHYRLSAAARYAKSNGYDAFSTSLLISPHQKHNLLKSAGQQVSLEIGLPFVYEDLRKHYSKSRAITRSLELYVQRYCGCLLSKNETLSVF